MEYVLERGILVEEVRYQYKPFSKFELNETPQEREESVAFYASLGKDENTDVEYVIYDDYYVVIYRNHDVKPYEKDFVKSLIESYTANANRIAREID